MEQSILVPANGTSSTTMQFSADPNALSGTYLLEVNATLFSPKWSQPGESSALFLVSVWNGTGQWPPPPRVE